MTKRHNRRNRRAKQPWWAAPWVWLTVGIILIGGGVVALTIGDMGSASAANTGSGEIAPDFSLAALDESTMTLSDYRGRYVLVNFWATWCPPCRAELPDLVSYYQAHAADGFMLIGVNEREPAATANTFLAGQGLDFPVVLDSSGSVMASYGVSALPSSFLVDPEGRIVQTWSGMIDRATLEHTVTPLLGG